MTGASRGLGAMVAGGLVGHQHLVIGLARSAPDDWDVPPEVERIVCDVTDERAVGNAFSEVRQQHAALDVVVNNAGFSKVVAHSATLTAGGLGGVIRTSRMA